MFGAVLIEGPKWCGKTWTSLNHALSVTYMTEKDKRDLANANPKYIFLEERPQLIDEWQLVPSIWDAVRHECDSDKKKGKFILKCWAYSKRIHEINIRKDIHERKDRKRDISKMRLLLRSLARNESSIAGHDTIVKDIMEN